MSRVMKNVKLQPVVSTLDYGNGGTVALSDNSPYKEIHGRIFFQHILNTAEVRAAKILAEAHEKSRLLLVEAEAQLKQMGQQAREEGFVIGYEEGKEAAMELMEEAEVILTEAQKERAAIVAAAEADIITLGLHLAEKIINHQLKINPIFLLAMLKASIVDIPGQPVVIRANPKDINLLKENEMELAALFPQGGYQIKADPEVEQGLILETEQGVIDNRSKCQLEALTKILGEVMVGG